MDGDLSDLRSSLKDIGLEYLAKKLLASLDRRRFIASVRYVTGGNVN